MDNNSEYIIGNIDFSMSMEDLPLTAENKEEMRKCIDGKIDLDKLIAETINNHRSEKNNSRISHKGTKVQR